MDNIIHECLRHRKIMDILLRYPRREFTINELSGEAKTPYATTWRFVQKLDKAGILWTRSIGHSTVCGLNNSSAFLKEIRRTLKKPTPQRAALEVFLNKARRLNGLDKIILFGSVASWEERLTSDVDIALLVKKRGGSLKKKVDEIVDHIASTSKVVIVPIILTEKELKENGQFYKEVEKGRILYVRRKGS